MDAVIVASTGTGESATPLHAYMTLRTFDVSSPPLPLPEGFRSNCVLPGGAFQTVVDGERGMYLLLEVRPGQLRVGLRPAPPFRPLL